MKKIIKNASRKRAVLILLIIAMIIIFPLGMFVVARYRFWLIYGIADSLRKGEKGLVSKIDVSDDLIAKIPTATSAETKPLLNALSNSKEKSSPPTVTKSASTILATRKLMTSQKK